MKTSVLLYRAATLITLLAILLPHSIIIPVRVARADGPVTPAGPPLGRNFDETQGPPVDAMATTTTQSVTSASSTTDPSGDVSPLNWLKPHPDRVRGMTIAGNTATITIPTWLIKNPASFYWYAGADRPSTGYTPLDWAPDSGTMQWNSDSSSSTTDPLDSSLQPYEDVTFVRVSQADARHIRFEWQFRGNIPTGQPDVDYYFVLNNFDWVLYLYPTARGWEWEVDAKNASFSWNSTSYEDIVSANVTELEGGQLQFQMTTASTIPTTPTSSQGAPWFGWKVDVDNNPATGQRPDGDDKHVVVRYNPQLEGMIRTWNGSYYEDFRSIPFTHSGSTVSTTANITDLGLAPTFRWAAGTTVIVGPAGEEFFSGPDRAPNSGWVGMSQNITTVFGKITVKNPDGSDSVPLREMQMELLSNGTPILTTTTKGGNGSDAGTYAFSLTPASQSNYRVRATLTQPTDINHAIGGFEVKYMPPLLSDPIPYIETANFSLDVNSVTRNLDFGQDFLNSGGTTNLGSSDREWLDDLAVIYYYIQQAERFAIEQLGVDSLNYVDVHAVDSNQDQTCWYTASDNVIVIASSKSHIGYPGRPENREWHEYFHHIMAETNLTAYPPERTCGNHKGFLNSTTGDSWVEGWAIFWAEALTEYLQLSDDYPNLYSDGVYVQEIFLGQPYKVWPQKADKNGKPVQLEDVAVASLLWDLHDNENENYDSFSLDLKVLKDVLLQKNPDSSYVQLTTMKKVYDALVARYPKEKVDDLFKAHGFFGDRGWVMQGCNNPPSPEGNKTPEPGETPGEGGRKDRPDLPLVEGANLLVKLQNEQGLPTETGWLTVRYTYLPPYDRYNAIIQRKTYNEHLFHIEPLPFEIPATIEVRGNSPQSAIWTSTNSDYWNAISGSGRDYVTEVTFTTRSTNIVYLPIIIKN